MNPVFVADKPSIPIPQVSIVRFEAGFIFTKKIQEVFFLPRHCPNISFGSQQLFDGRNNSVIPKMFFFLNKKKAHMEFPHGVLVTHLEFTKNYISCTYPFMQIHIFWS